MNSRMAREATLSVSLTNQLRDYVRAKVESGRYESASEVIRESLRSMQDDEKRQHLYWADVREKVKEARIAIGRRDVVDGPKYMKRKISHLKSRPPRKGVSARARGA
jgi:antitoxin ParD1/3/4